MFSIDSQYWLGLLKWSLAQTDGTSETESRPMGQEDVSFLTKVMEELVADEPKRLKDMMMEIASFLGELSAGEEGKNIADMPREEQQEHMEDLFEELKLSKGGAVLEVNGVLDVERTPREYEDIYFRFGELLRDGRSDADDSPLRLVADAYLVGRRTETEAFYDEQA